MIYNDNIVRELDATGISVRDGGVWNRERERERESVYIRNYVSWERDEK